MIHVSMMLQQIQMMVWYLSSIYTDDSYLEYDALINTDDGSCATLIVLCTIQIIYMTLLLLLMMVHVTLVVFGCTDDSYAV